MASETIGGGGCWRHGVLISGVSRPHLPGHHLPGNGHAGNEAFAGDGEPVHEVDGVVPGRGAPQQDAGADVTVEVTDTYHAPIQGHGAMIFEVMLPALLTLPLPPGPDSETVAKLP